MSRLMRSTLVLAVLLSSGSAIAFRPVMFGPPWISIEYPPSPYDQTTREAFLLVHAFHHGTPANYPARGTAEGIAGGVRRSMPLTFAATSRTGVYALRRQWPTDGRWVLAISVTQAPNDSVTALVKLGPDGQVVSVQVPTEHRAGWNVATPREVTKGEIELALKN